MKYYTPKEAQSTLPLVREIVNDILKTGQDMKFMASQTTTDLNENPVFMEKREKLESYLKELHELNCDFKDWNFTFGLVDFPAIIDGEEVLLCWKSDEAQIAYYHSFDGGYAGRKEIPKEYLESLLSGKKKIREGGWKSAFPWLIL